MQVVHERVKVPVGSLSMPAYVARPTAPGTYPSVIVFQEIFGVNHHIRSVADRVAAEGYVALAPEVFYRTAPGLELKYDADGLGRGIELMGKVTATEAMADVAGALAYLKGRPEVGGRGTGAMGFCFGGHLTYLSACEHPIAAAASFYGGGIAVGSPGNDGPPTRRPDVQDQGACALPLRRERRLHPEGAGRRRSRRRWPRPTSATRSSSIRASATGSSATSGPTTTRRRPRMRGAG